MAVLDLTGEGIGAGVVALKSAAKRFVDALDLPDISSAISCPKCYWYRKTGLTQDIFPYTVVPGLSYFALGTPDAPPPKPGFELVGVKTSTEPT